MFSRLIASFLLFSFSLQAQQSLSLDVISYEEFTRRDPAALQTLEQALYEKGIVGIRGVPGYREKVNNLIEKAREFFALSEEIKEQYAPDHSKGDMFLGYEKGKEKFKRPDGRWVVDDLKVSFYAFVPDHPTNKWPREMALQGSFEELGSLMADMGKQVMETIGLIGPRTGINLDDTPYVGRMLYYKKCQDTDTENPYWCGAHFDHGLFTVLIPAFYFVGEQAVDEPLEAGLFVKPTKGDQFQKVAANDPEIMLFQVGEFGQLATNDAIHATEHRVHKAPGAIERYTMALFFSAPQDAVVYSTSELTSDSRYGAEPGGRCDYRQWEEASFKRYIVEE